MGKLDIVEEYVEPESEAAIDPIEEDPIENVEPPEDPGGFDDEKELLRYEAEGML